MRFADIFTGSFHSADTYRQVRSSNRFFLGYAYTITAFTALVVVVYFLSLAHRELFTGHNGNPPVFDETVNQIAEQLPVMSYSDGKLISKNPQPTVVYVTGQAFGTRWDNHALITVDTSGASNHTNMQTQFLVTATELIAKTRDDIKIAPVRELFTNDSMIINRAVMEETAAAIIASTHSNLSKIYFILGFTCWVALTFFMCLMRTAMLLILASAGVLIGNLLRSPIKYQQSLALAAVSYTPIALLDIFALIAFGTEARGLTLFVAGLVALAAAILCTSQKNARAAA